MMQQSGDFSEGLVIHLIPAVVGLFISFAIWQADLIKEFTGISGLLEKADRLKIDVLSDEPNGAVAQTKRQGIVHDLALICPDEVMPTAIEQAVRNCAGDLVTDVRIVHDYRRPSAPAGTKKLAVRVVLQDDGATFADSPDDTVVPMILEALHEHCQATIANAQTLDASAIEGEPTGNCTSRFPAVIRDLALTVPLEVTPEDVERVVRTIEDPLISDVRVTRDYFSPQITPDTQTLTAHIVLQRNDTRLADTMADEHLATIIAALHERCDAEMRT